MPRKSLTSDLSTIAGRCRARAIAATDFVRGYSYGELARRCQVLGIRPPCTALAAAMALAFATIPEPMPIRTPSRTRRAAR
jgi:hypothetical protein